MGTRLIRLAVAGLIGIVAIAMVAAATMSPRHATGQTADCGNLVQNANFANRFESWSTTGMPYSTAPEGSSYGGHAGLYNGDTLSQVIDTSNFVGQPLTLNFSSQMGGADPGSMTGTIGGGSATIQTTGSEQSTSIPFVPTASETLLTFSATSGGNGPQQVYNISIPVPCEVPTETPSPTSTPTETPAPTNTPTITPTPEPTQVPDTSLDVTGDPRFPITGSVSTDDYIDWTFALATLPANGSVDLQSSGEFSYTASNIWLSGDEFTFLATAPGGETATITVTIVYAIDPGVPTTGTVEPGGTGSGGPVNDARDGSSSGASPTQTPESSDSDGRVDRP
jgi:hypothetical protein